MNSNPGGFSEADWHQTASADSGTSHTLLGRQYVVACEWCPEVFYGPTKAEAVWNFRLHEDEMADECDRERKPRRDDRQAAERMVFR
jgi:hypothetical protein